MDGVHPQARTRHLLPEPLTVLRQVVGDVRLRRSILLQHVVEVFLEGLLLLAGQQRRADMLLEVGLVVIVVGSKNTFSWIYNGFFRSYRILSQKTTRIPNLVSES